MLGGPNLSFIDNLFSLVKKYFYPLSVVVFKYLEIFKV